MEDGILDAVEAAQRKKYILEQMGAQGMIKYDSDEATSSSSGDGDSETLLSESGFEDAKEDLNGEATIASEPVQIWLSRCGSDLCGCRSGLC